MKKGLVLAAHPDDEVLMAGGLMNATNKDIEWHVLFFTLSDAANPPGTSRYERSKQALERAIKVSKVIGFEPHFLADPEFDVQNSTGGWLDMGLGDKKREVLMNLIQYFRQIKPDVVVGHKDVDFHVDHRTVGELWPEALYQATRPGVLSHIGDSIEWPLALSADVDLEWRNLSWPDYVYELEDDDVKKKAYALTLYEIEGEHQLFSDEELKQWVDITARIRGSVMGWKYGEGFNLVNMIPRRLSL